jgi:NADH dehydrogenase
MCKNFARTPLEVLVMGRNVFTQISSSLVPFRNIIVDAVKRRSLNQWQHLPVVSKILEQHPLTSFVEPLESLLRPEWTFAETLKIFNENSLDFCCVINKDNHLKGILTRTDLLRAFEVGTYLNLKVQDFIVADPVTITIDDSSVVAALTIRDHGLKCLPVIDNYDSRKIKGYIKAGKMLDRVLQQVITESHSQVLVRSENSDQVIVNDSSGVFISRIPS